MVSLVDLAHLPGPERASLEEALSPLTMLQDVVRWGFSLSPAREVVEVVTQDEFTHDVVIAWREEAWLVFDCT
jgi:hypothetical protein